MRGILLLGGLVLAFPAVARQNAPVAAPDQAAPLHVSTRASRQSQNPIGQALAGLLQDAARTQSRHPATRNAPPTPSTPRPNAARTDATDAPAPVEVALH
jgi:hypothetical protein